MPVKAYRISGQFRMGHITSPFTIETVGRDEADARDRVLATIGSRHRVNRHQVRLDKVTEIPADQITDLAVEKKRSMVK